MLNKSYLLLLSLCFAATTSQAQKMNVLDYFKAFMNNEKSPNNIMAKLKATIQEKQGEMFIYYSATDKYPAKIQVKNNYSAFVNGFHEGWNGQCYPTFKVYTRADGKQVLGVTEDSYTHHSYRSKYSYSAPTWSGGYEKSLFIKRR